MPGFDGTGPRGEGAMTGGGKGYCALPAGQAGRQLDRGFFYGGCRGRGRRNRFYATGLHGWVRGDNELEALKSQADSLKQRLEATQARIQAVAGQQKPDQT